MTHTQLKRIEPLLNCLECQADLELVEDAFKCRECSARYPVIDGVPRFVPPSFYSFDQNTSTIQEKTKNYFGFEWEHFKNWGFINESDVPEEEHYIYDGGFVSNRRSGFDSKCRLAQNEMLENTITLDAGCGNGRYTYEAGSRSKGLVIGVDIGYGSVKSASQNTKPLGNVIILQCDLLQLPFKTDVISNAFSNGVLMHTGNAEKAFTEVSRTVKVGGAFVAHVYNQLNPVWEFNDWWMRKITTRLSVTSGMRFASLMAQIARTIHFIPGGVKAVNQFFRLQPSVIHMFDWYSAPAASHHTPQELALWFQNSHFKLLDPVPERQLWRHPWASNLKGEKEKE